MGRITLALLAYTVLLAPGCSLKRRDGTSLHVHNSCGTECATSPGEPIMDNSVRTELAILFDQRFQVGQLEVDLEKFEQMTTAHRDACKQAAAEVADYQKEVDDQRRQELLERARMALEAFDTQTATQCLNECGVTPNCAYPLTHDDGPGPSGFPFIPQALTPVDIPFRIPVTMRAGVDRSALRRSRVESRPLKPKCKPNDSATESCTTQGCATNLAPPSEPAAAVRVGDPIVATPNELGQILAGDAKYLPISTRSQTSTSEE